MTKENRELLLKDLCARLPYGVIVDYKENEFEIPHWKITTIYPETMDGWIGYDKRIGAGSESGSRPFKIGEIKPYLRPMSSMTEEEKQEILRAWNIKASFVGSMCDAIVSDNTWWGGKDKSEPLGFDSVPFKYMSAVIDWLDKNMFDHRGLIPMGLALEASKDMYKK